MDDPHADPGFAPQDLSDGREPGNWQTRYPDLPARRSILFESIYCAVLLLLCPILLLVTWLTDVCSILPLKVEHAETLRRYSYAWIGGLLGGTLFVLKWLYHSVAHYSWNRDRRLWRLLAPHLSAALAFVFVCMVDSKIIAIFDGTALNRPAVVLAVSFLVGYFSDNALAKMSEVANSLFGTVSASGYSKKPEPRTAAPKKGNEQ